MRVLLDLVFPPKCAGCDLPGTLLCEHCASGVVGIDPRASCCRCGAPCGPTGCHECKGRTFAFSEARCASLLAHPVSRAIVLLKDGGERRYADVLGHLLADVAAGWLDPREVIVPVPASPDAVRRRGFDHAVDLARVLARASGTPMARALRASATADQRALGRGERFINRADAFRLRMECPPSKRVVLVDDVFTTGATLDAAARVLRTGGVDEVRALAVARAVRRPA